MSPDLLHISSSLRLGDALIHTHAYVYARQVVPQWERTVEAVGNTALIIKLVRGGTLFYMWSECLFGLVEEAGALAAAVTVAVRPVAVYAFSSVSALSDPKYYVPTIVFCADSERIRTRV